MGEVFFLADICLFDWYLGPILGRRGHGIARVASRETRSTDSVQER